MKNLFFLALLAVPFIAAYTKENAEPEPALKVELLTGKDWMRTGSTITVNGVTTDTHATLSACDKDDYMRFEEAQEMFYDEGASKCSAASPQRIKGVRWVDDGKMILGMGISNGHNGAHQVIELSANTLTFAQTIADKRYTYTFTKR
ncbi:hypothetical protein SAMN00120144_1160 [Hymenobacter roseosalivarius DSM 11622]|uniref:Lipocalin-like domain-containing protein n=1 Tax=Hymenobacter roseosalivarius DSM 11622 TaxID=645990 RepID=A0A1W1V4X6_9BACT|nr:hypothetical protein [Hymenobacter roseosalivarius]SMB88101.1 hypothetical protein SAMN00120144_1160 [Hymenobacter roseosalivarius DSM 11622]